MFLSVSLGGMESRFRIAPAQSLHGHVDGEHDGRAIGRERAIEQLGIEAAIAHEIDLEPERFLHRAAHVFDGADGHGGEAEGHPKRLRGARA
jgi:hypothetical protein